MIKPVKRLTDCYERACKNIIGLSILQGSVIRLTKTINFNRIENRVNMQIRNRETSVLFCLGGELHIPADM